MNTLDAPTGLSNVRPLTLQELDEITGGIIETYTVITRTGRTKTVMGPKPLPDWLGGCTC